ncbi:MAG: PD-(D/E)XK nuclease family protein [Oscillatoriales cyanobacterium SM2_3_0]|nr:PD-(D/E)XK nuclease family protein [Oscillatoriales cyanobacterium SM2_3_0]
MLIRLSQAQLNLLETCPRKFQHTYLEQLTAPVSPEEEVRSDWGSQFHLLMQQREMGLPIDILLETDPELKQCLHEFLQAAPELFPADKSSDFSFRDPEHQRTFKFENCLLTVVYDLLIAQENLARILDWKTYPRPKNRHYLAQNWQTRLYLYSLVETSDYAPEQVSMTYWFVRPNSGEPPASITFHYSHQSHQKNREDLAELLQQLEGYLENYAQGQALPQISVTQGLCQSCQFSWRCQRTDQPKDSPAIVLNSLPDLDRIKEVSI